MIARLSLVVFLFVGIAQAQPADVAWRTIAPGVEHAEIKRGEPWTINALRVDLAQARLDAVHALDAAVGLETVSSMAERRNAIAAINGGYFRTTGTFRGDSIGTLQIDGTLLSEPDRSRVAVGFIRSRTGATQLMFGHVTWTATVDAGGQKRPLDGVNRPRGTGEMVMFTPAFHQTTLTDASGTEIVVRRGRVEEVREGAGSTPIPADGFVLSVRGAARDWARQHLRRRTRVKVSAALTPADLVAGKDAWTTAEDVVGGGPRIVSAGRVNITLEREKVAPSFSTTRHPRTAIASLPGNKALLVVVDGRQPTLSVGMSLDELARLMIELGAVDAINLDGGGSSTMTLGGKVVNHPSDLTGERPVSDAILVLPAVPAPPARR